MEPYFGIVYICPLIVSIICFEPRICIVSAVGFALSIAELTLPLREDVFYIADIHIGTYVRRWMGITTALILCMQKGTVRWLVMSIISATDTIVGFVFAQYLFEYDLVLCIAYILVACTSFLIGMGPVIIRPVLYVLAIICLVAQLITLEAYIDAIFLASASSLAMLSVYSAEFVKNTSAFVVLASRILDTDELL